MPSKHLHILGLPADADMELVTKRFRQLAMHLHPDRTGNALDDKFLRLCEAYRLLRHHFNEQAITNNGTANQPERKTGWDGTNRRQGRRGCRTQRRFHTVCHSDFKGVHLNVKA